MCALSNVEGKLRTDADSARPDVIPGSKFLTLGRPDFPGPIVLADLTGCVAVFKPNTDLAARADGSRSHEHDSACIVSYPQDHLAGLGR